MGTSSTLVHFVAERGVQVGASKGMIGVIALRPSSHLPGASTSPPPFRHARRRSRFGGWALCLRQAPERRRENGRPRREAFSGLGALANWIAADILRIQDGVLVEHWDVIQDEATQEQSKSGRPMFGDSFPVHR
jgi:hypothetical protein